MKLPFFTIGHSNRSLEEFVELLGSAEIGLVADVRKFPRSRANPQFNQDTLGKSLAPFGISYEGMGALGGRRGVVKSISPDVNGLWRNLSFHNYATMRFPQSSARDCNICWSGDASIGVRLCVRRRCGGGAIGGLLRII